MARDGFLVVAKEVLGLNDMDNTMDQSHEIFLFIRTRGYRGIGIKRPLELLGISPKTVPRLPPKRHPQTPNH